MLFDVSPIKGKVCVSSPWTWMRLWLFQAIEDGRSDNKGFLRRAIKGIWISHMFAETLTLRALTGSEKSDFPGATMSWGSHTNRDAVVASPCLWVTPAQNPDMWLNVTLQPCHFPSRGPKHFKHRWALPCLLPEFLTSEFLGHNK